MPNLKQGTLSFTSAKRTNSILNGKRISTTEKGKNKRVETPVEVQNDAKLSGVVEISSDEEDAVETTVPTKRTRASTRKWSSSGTAKPQLSQSEKEEPSPAGIERERLNVEDKAGRYRKYYNEVRSKMGYIQPGKSTLLTVPTVETEGLSLFHLIVHSEGQTKILQMLRFFDM